MTDNKTVPGFWATFVRTLAGAIFNRDTFVVCVIGVAFYLVFYAWPYGNQQIEHMPVAVVDLDQSSASRKFISALDAAPTVDIVERTNSEAVGLDALKRGRAYVVVTLPSNYAQDLAQGKNTSVHILASGVFPVKGRAIQATVGSLIMDPGLKTGDAAVLAAGTPGPIFEKQQRFHHKQVVSQYRYNEIGGYANYTVPVVGPVILQAVMLMAITMAVGGWLCQHARPAFVINALHYPGRCGLGAYFAFWVMAFVWFLYMQGFDFWRNQYGAMSNMPGVFVTGALFSAAVVAMAFAITLVMGSNRWSSQAVVMVSAPAVFMSGAIWPSQNITNPFVYGFAQLLPSTPGIRAIVATAQDSAGIGAVMPSLVMLFIQTIGYLMIASAFAKRRLTPDRPATYSVNDVK